MIETPWWGWVGLIALAATPVPGMFLGLVGINIITVAVLGLLWLMWPHIGSLVYTAVWVNLVGYRVLFCGKMRAAFPMTVNNQNGASAWLMILGVIGAIRSGLAHDGLGIALGAVAAVVLFFSQGPLFGPAR